MVAITSTDHLSPQQAPKTTVRLGGSECMTDGGDRDDQAYLISVAYESDAERKRAEYLLNNWDEGSVEPLRGLTRRVHDIDIQDLYDKLVAKVPEDHVRVFELSSVDARAKTVEETIEYTVDVDSERVEWAMESLLNKRKAVAEDVANNEYALRTKKGRAKVAYNVEETPEDDVHLRIRIEGYGDAANFLREFFEEELSYMVT
jgi:hypothetical protein